jgi:hypothetical protein
VYFYIRMSWYSIVFDKVPAKGSPVTVHEIPRVLEDPGINEEVLAEEATDLDILFRPTFSFSGIPTNPDEDKIFLEQEKTRSQNPANIKLEGLQSEIKNIADIYAGEPAGKIYSAAASVVNGVWGFGAGLVNYFTKPGSIKGGGNRKTQKRSKHSKTFTQSRRPKVSTNSEYK